MTRPATEPWTSGIPDFVTAGGDVIYHPTHQSNLWLMVASQPQAGKDGEQWVDDLLAELGSMDECGPPGDSIAIDGFQGRWCGENVVAVSSGDRGYAIRLYTSGDDPSIGDTYDRAWFEEVLATVQLRPEDALPPALTETFASERHGVSISYPAGWVTRPATEPWTSGIPDFTATAGDVIYHPTLQEGLWIVAASQPLAGKGGEQWVDDALAELVSADFCESPLEDTVVEIDGVQGRECAPSAVAVSAGDRGYLIMLYVSGDDPAVGATYDQAWFQEVLAAVQLRPEDAVE